MILLVVRDTLKGENTLFLYNTAEIRLSVEIVGVTNTMLDAVAVIEKLDFGVSHPVDTKGKEYGEELIVKLKVEGVGKIDVPLNVKSVADNIDTSVSVVISKVSLKIAICVVKGDGGVRANIGIPKVIPVFGSAVGNPVGTTLGGIGLVILLLLKI